MAELNVGRHVAGTGLKIGKAVSNLAHQIRRERRKEPGEKNKNDGRAAKLRSSEQRDSERQRDDGRSGGVRVECEPARDSQHQHPSKIRPFPDPDREVERRQDAGLRQVDVGEGYLLERRPSGQREHQRPNQSEPPIDEMAAANVGEDEFQSRDDAHEQRHGEPGLVKNERNGQQVEPHRTAMHCATKNRALQREELSDADPIRGVDVSCRIGNLQGVAVRRNVNRRQDQQHGNMLP